MITGTDLLISCTTDEETLAAAVHAIESVYDLIPGMLYVVRSDFDQGDGSIEISMDGNVPVAGPIEMLTAILPFMVDNVEIDVRLRERDRYEARDQNGDVLYRSDNWGLVTTQFASWSHGADESNEGAGIYDNATGKMVLTLRFTEDE